MKLESFSREASELISLIRFTHGSDIAQELILRCFQRSKREKINISTVYAVLGEMNGERE